MDEPAKKAVVGKKWEGKVGTELATELTAKAGIELVSIGVVELVALIIMQKGSILG